MKAEATKADKSRRWKALSQVQLNAVDCLLSGMTDGETAADPRVNVVRQTVWEWRTGDVLFKAELQQRRATLWAASSEQLRGLMGKAIANIAKSIEDGDVTASWHLLKAVGMFGVTSGVQGCHIEHELRSQAQNQARAEQDALNDDGSMTGALERINFNVPQRTEAIFAELLEEYTEEA